jgi:phospholipid/cholesterol/gamma-HCH transport system substrate-binding protein
MNRETKLGIFAIAILATTIWGYYFLKGRNLLSRSQIFYVEYQDIGDLMVSSPVKINGFQVGSVTNITLKKADMRTILAELHIDKSIRVPRNARAVIEPLGIMGGAGIALVFDKPCIESDCAISGATLAGGSASLISKMLDGNQLDSYLQRLRSGVGELLDTLDASSTDPEARDLVGQSLYDTRQILHNTRVTTEQLALLVARLGTQLQAVMGDLQGVTGTLKANNQEIASILTNTSAISAQVRDADLGKTISETRETLDGLQTTVASLGTVASDLQTVLNKINQGDGTMGKLINDPEMYANLLRTSRNLDLLLQDFRLNPRRYVNVSLIGRKDKEYVFPEEDPAYPGTQR